MKRTIAAFWGLFLMVGFLVGGCNNQSTGPESDLAPVGVTNEQEAMKYFAMEDEFVKNAEATFTDDAVQPMDYGTFGKVDAAITPLRFGRFVTSVTHTATVTTMPGDSIAVVNIQKTIEGVFKIKALDANGDTLADVIEKPFTDHAARNVIFKRVNRDRVRYWKNWLPVATSLVSGGTVAPNNNIEITMVQMFLPNGDTITVTDPENYYLRYRWTRLFDGGRKDVPELLGGQRVLLQATVVSSSPDTDLVALRYGVGLFMRRRMHMNLISEINNGGSYTRVYEVPFFVHFHKGWFHAGIDAVTRETLFDDQAPYSVSWWGVPYRVF